MSAGAATPGGETEGQSLEIKGSNPRISHADLAVFALALLLIAAGGTLKQIHDNRTVSAEVGGLVVTYPRGWLRYPVDEPELLRAVSNVDGETTLVLFAAPAGQTDLSQAVSYGGGNPAAGRMAYTQIANEQVDLHGTPAFRTDYAYVNPRLNGASSPEVIRGRQIAWMMNDQVHILALESPDRGWSEAENLFDLIVDHLQF